MVIIEFETTNAHKKHDMGNNQICGCAIEGSLEESYALERRLRTSTDEDDIRSQDGDFEMMDSLRSSQPAPEWGHSV